MGEKAKMKYETHLVISLFGMSAGGLESLVGNPEVGTAVITGFGAYFITALVGYFVKVWDKLKREYLM